MNTRRLWFAFAFLLLAPALAGLAAEKDNYGDPLPEGAKARLGTTRLRMVSFSTPILTPDGKSLYTHAAGGVSRVDPATGAVQGKVPAQFFGTPSVLSADGKVAVNTSYDRVTAWDTATGKALAKVERRLPGSASPASISADGKILAIGGTGDAGKKEAAAALVWNVGTDKEIQKITVPQNQYANVAISADGKTLATWGGHTDPDAKIGFNNPDSLSKFVHFWDATSGKELAKFRSAGYMPSAVVFSPAGTLAAVANGNSTIDLVDPKTGASKHLLLGRSQMGRWVAFSPDGATVAATSYDGAVQRWKTSDGSRLSTTESPVTNPFNPRVRVVSNDKAIAWAGKGSATVVWEVPSGKLISPEGGHTGLVRGVAVTPDNKHVLTSGEDGATLKWELQTGKPVGPVEIKPPGNLFGAYLPAAIFSPDTTRALVRDGSGLGVYDMATGTQLYVIPTPTEGSSFGHFSADGTKVVVATSSFNTKQAPAQVTVWDVATSKKVAGVELPGFSNVAAALTPDGKHIVTAGTKPEEKGPGDFFITAWDAATGAKKGEYSEQPGFNTPHVAAGPDNASALVVTSKGALVKFDIGTGKLGKPLDINRRSPALAPVFSRDGKLVAVGCQTDFGPNPTAPILVIEWDTGKVKKEFSGTGGAPTGMVFSPDGKWLVTGSPDTTAIVWDLGK